MFPIPFSNSIKKSIKVGGFVYDGGAWKCRIEGITTVNDEIVDKADVSEIRSLSLTINDSRFPTKAYEKVIGKMLPTEVPFHQIFLKKTDAVAYSEAWKASWDVFNKFSYETDRPYKISKRKHQVTLRMLPSSLGEVDTIEALRACTKHTYKGSDPFAFVFFDNGEFRVFYEGKVPLIIPSPNHISYEHIVTILTLGLGKNLAKDIPYEQGRIYYL